MKQTNNEPPFNPITEHTMKHRHHFQTYTPSPRVNAFWAILTICAAAGVITVMALYAAGILTK